VCVCVCEYSDIRVILVKECTCVLVRIL